MKIEQLQLEWASKEVEEYCAQLRAEIQKTMTLPEWAMRRPDIYAEAYRRAFEASEVMRRELVMLTVRYSWPRYVITGA